MSRKFLIISFIFEILFIALSAFRNVNILLAVAINLWTIIFIYYTTRIKENITIWCFLIAFFVFLLGREICFYYFGLERYYLYLEKENNFTYFCLCLALSGICFGSYLGSGKLKLAINGNYFRDDNNIVTNYDNNTQKTCKYAFLFCYVFSIISVLYQIVYVRTVGYLASYSENGIGSGVPSFVSYIAAFTNIALCFFLATKPEKKECSKILFMYEVYAVMTMFSGVRYPFIGISMFILIYYFIRDKLDGGWIRKKYLILLCVLVPILIILMEISGTVRTGGEFSFASFGKTLENFLDEQGGSINMIKRVKYFAKDLQDLHFTSFSNLYSNLFENSIMRNLFGMVTYTGNSIEHALHGHSLMHRLSYYTYGTGYLNGMGVGSCFIAELYHDFSYLGIILGSTLYGFLMKKIDEIKLNRYLHDGILLSFVYALLLSPRGDFDTFIANIINLYSIAGILLVIILNNIIRRQHSGLYSYSKKRI